MEEKPSQACVCLRYCSPGWFLLAELKLSSHLRRPPARAGWTGLSAAGEGGNARSEGGGGIRCSSDEDEGMNRKPVQKNKTKTNKKNPRKLLLLYAAPRRRPGCGTAPVHPPAFWQINRKSD